MSALTAVVVAALLAIAVLHAVWLFSPWPLATPADLARDVVGRSDGSLPRRLFVPATVGVVVALALAAFLVGAHGGLLDPPSESLARVGTWGVAAVLLGRGAYGLLESGARLGDHPASYRRLDLRFYSPLCLVLGGLTAVVAAG